MKNKTEYLPIIRKCQHCEKGKYCKRCKNTGDYIDGYILVTTTKEGKQIAWEVDTIK